MSFLSSYSKVFENVLLNIGTNLKSYIAFNVNEEKKLFSAISYAYANGGKRLRPVLALLTAEAVMQRSQNAEIGVREQCHNGTVAERASSRLRRTNDRSVLGVHEDHEDDENAEIGVREQCQNPAMGLALAIELIHCGSLVHDDLPCMDNDDLRRGKPTNHIVYGEDIALLTGDFLLVNPISVFIEYSKDVLGLNDSLILKVVGNLTLAVQQMIVGQAMDLELARLNLQLKTEEDEVRQQDTVQRSRLEYFEKSRLMQEFKTGALLSASIINGAILAGADTNQLKALEKYAANLGLAFQIVDDVLDHTATPEQMGKQTQKDAQQNKLTYVDLYGIEGARAKASELITEAKEILSATQIYSDKLKLVADYVLHRNN
jgi:geranylgeranyl diphosphate synthase type II